MFYAEESFAYTGWSLKEIVGVFRRHLQINFLEKNAFTLILMSLQLGPKGPIYNDISFEIKAAGTFAKGPYFTISSLFCASNICTYAGNM